MVSTPPSPYEEYIRVGELLALHSPRTEHPAEDMFVAVHQVSELWLAALLRETRAAGRLLADEDTSEAARRLRTGADVLAQLSGALNMLCGMLPTEFAAFRPALGTASAVQSRQYVEFVHACRGPGRSLWKEFADLADKRGGLTKVYETPDTGVREVAELLVDLDDAHFEWMSFHWRLVRRQIGAAAGTGGRSADYLRDQLDQRLFPELLEIRPEFHITEEVSGR